MFKCFRRRQPALAPYRNNYDRYDYVYEEREFEVMDSWLEVRMADGRHFPIRQPGHVEKTLPVINLSFTSDGRGYPVSGAERVLRQYKQEGYLMLKDYNGHLYTLHDAPFVESDVVHVLGKAGIASIQKLSDTSRKVTASIGRVVEKP